MQGFFVSNQFNGVALHVVIDVDVLLCDRNAAMPRKACQYANANAFAGKVGDKAASAAVATGAINANFSIQPEKVLCQSVGTEGLATSCHEQGQ